MPRAKIFDGDVISTTIRLPKELRNELENVAKSEHWSFNQAVVEAVKLLVKTKT